MKEDHLYPDDLPYASTHVLIDALQAIERQCLPVFAAFGSKLVPHVAYIAGPVGCQRIRQKFGLHDVLARLLPVHHAVLRDDELVPRIPRRIRHIHQHAAAVESNCSPG